MTDQQLSGPRCKFCGEVFQVTPGGQPICTFDPRPGKRWAGLELTEAEHQAVEEAEALSQVWVKDMREQGKTLCPVPYFNKQSDRNYWLSEGAFEKLLLGGLMVCVSCYSAYTKEPGIYEDYSKELH